MYKRVICVGTIWDLDDFAYPELDDYSSMTRWNYVQIMGHQLCSSSKETKNVVKMPLFPRNQHGIRVRACCASCLFKEVRTDGKRYCSCRHQLVESLNKCRYWQMSEQLEMVGQ
jgi:hypothetical protein